MIDSKRWIYENIDKLETPGGSFVVSDGNNNLLFSVCENPINSPCEIYDDNGTVIGRVGTETNYRIAIPTLNLIIGKEYKISFSSGKWEMCDLDEHTTCFNTVIGEWVVGIGAYDPNDQNKEEQMYENAYQKGYLEKGFVQELEQYDESEFVKYTVDALDDYNGYTFKLFDYSEEYIYFEVAWVKANEYPLVEYEGALGCWLS